MNRQLTNESDDVVLGKRMTLSEDSNMCKYFKTCTKNYNCSEPRKNSALFVCRS